MGYKNPTVRKPQPRKYKKTGWLGQEAMIVPNPLEIEKTAGLAHRNPIVALILHFIAKSDRRSTAERHVKNRLEEQR